MKTVKSENINVGLYQPPQIVVVSAFVVARIVAVSTPDPIESSDDPLQSFYRGDDIDL